MTDKKNALAASNGSGANDGQCHKGTGPSKQTNPVFREIFQRSETDILLVREIFRGHEAQGKKLIQRWKNRLLVMERDFGTTDVVFSSDGMEGIYSDVRLTLGYVVAVEDFLQRMTAAACQAIGETAADRIILELENKAIRAENERLNKIISSLVSIIGMEGRTA